MYRLFRMYRPYRLLIKLVLILGFSIPFTISAEVRALWVMPWSLTSKAKIDSIVDNALNSGHNELLVEVRYRSDALYQTNRRSTRFFNPEPRSHVLNNNNGFDPLEYVLERAHRVNIKVQAWVVVFNATPTDRQLIQQNYIYQNHFDWITHDSSGNKMKNTDQFGYYIDPGIPEAQSYLLEVLSDIVDGYPELDGLHLDYIRYPNQNVGHHPLSVKRYNEAKTNGKSYTWNEWRQENVSTFVRQLYQQVKSINPDIQLSAAVIANYHEATSLYAQEWEKWLDEGIIDRIYPMLYNTDPVLFHRNLDRIARMPRTNDIVVGLRAWNANGNSLSDKNHNKRNTNVSSVSEKVSSIRKHGFGGLCFFSYESLILDNALFDLAARIYPSSFAEPALVDIKEPVSSLEQPQIVLEKNVFLEPTMESVPHTSDLSISFDANNDLESRYIIRLLVPNEGRWKWEIRSSDNMVLYQRYRYYFKGENVDYWSGILDDGEHIQTGSYTIHIYQNEHKSKIVPLILEGKS